MVSPGEDGNDDMDMSRWVMRRHSRVELGFDPMLNGVGLRYQVADGCMGESVRWVR